MEHYQQRTTSVAEMLPWETSDPIYEELKGFEEMGKSFKELEDLHQLRPCLGQDAQMYPSDICQEVLQLRTWSMSSLATFLAASRLICRGGLLGS